jgi:hypothetical protein
VRLVPAILLFFASGDYISVQKKFETIASDRLRPGARVFLSSRELDAFARGQALEIAPKAIRDVKFQIGEGSATASAMVNFLELDKSRGGQPNWLMEKFLQGERAVKVSARVQSRNGEARVDVDRVEVAGAAIEGAALDFLIEHYVIPQFPEARVAEWFKMSHHIDHLEIHPSGVTVVIGK